MSESQPTINPALTLMNSELDILCKLIREEKVIFWVGSGFSSYAGYPTGTQLPSILLSSLGELPEGAPNPGSALLQEAADYYVEQRDRSGLNSFLVEQYGKEPLRCDIHDSLALINRVKYIVTTNYDPLFEHAYGDKIVAISRDEDLPGSTEYPDKTILLKIHGDITQPDTIVITSDDYRKFDSDTIFWSKIRTLLAEYSVVFIGYSLHDPNVEKMLGDIYARLKENRHPYFFIDWKIDDAKRKDLAAYDLHFIEMNAAAAIEYITGNAIQYSFVDGMEKPSLLAKSDQIFNHQGFRVDRSFSADKISHVSLIPIRPDVHHTINFTLSSKTGESSDLKDFCNLMTGYSFEPVTLQASTCDIIIRKSEMNGVFTIDPAITTFQSLELKPHPLKEIVVDLQSEKTPLRLNNLQTKIFNSNVLMQLEINDPDFRFTLVVTHATREGTINFETHHLVTDIDRGRIIYGLLDGLEHGDNIKILSSDFEGSLVIPSHEISINKPKRGVQSIHEIYQIYSDLSDIQNSLKIKIKLPRDEIKGEDLDNIHYIATMVRGRREKINEVTTTYENTEHARNLLTQKDGPGIQFNGDGTRNFSVFNQTIRVPVIIEGFELILTNEPEIRAAIERGDKDLRFRWKSKTGKFFGRFSTLQADSDAILSHQQEARQ